MTGHGLHVDTYCPTCEHPLDLAQTNRLHALETVGVLICDRCMVEWVVQVRLAQGPRLAKTRTKHDRRQVHAEA